LISLKKLIFIIFKHHIMSELKKTLNTRGLTMIAVGACIGSGIFVTPANTIYLLPHQGYVLLAWAIGGCIAFLGALTFSELGARYPQNGGIYVYLKNAFGPLYGFLYGWITLFIVNTGALAALGFALAEYLTYFVKLSDAGKSVLAIIVIWGTNHIKYLWSQCITGICVIVHRFEAIRHVIDHFSRNVFFTQFL
jgi:amino acid transporter